jgi:hypothetical protein
LACGWPTQGQGHNWDAIARIELKGSSEWLLVEAKANIQELTSNCRAEDPSRKLIERTLDATKVALRARGNCDWTKRYYQYCNRLAALHFINSNGSPARLLFVYFYGDIEGKRRTCPASEAKWARALADLDAHVALPADHDMYKRIHKVFIDVQCIG